MALLNLSPLPLLCNYCPFWVLWSLVFVTELPPCPLSMVSAGKSYQDDSSLLVVHLPSFQTTTHGALLSILDLHHPFLYLTCPLCTSAFRASLNFLVCDFQVLFLLPRMSPWLHPIFPTSPEKQYVFSNVLQTSHSVPLFPLIKFEISFDFVPILLLNYSYISTIPAFLKSI